MTLRVIVDALVWLRGGDKKQITQVVLNDNKKNNRQLAVYNMFF